VRHLNSDDDPNKDKQQTVSVHDTPVRHAKNKLPASAHDTQPQSAKEDPFVSDGDTLIQLSKDEQPRSDRDTPAQPSNDDQPAGAATRSAAADPVGRPSDPKSAQVAVSASAESARDSVSLISEGSFLGSHSAITQVDTPGGWQLCRIMLTRLGGAAVVGLLLSIAAAVFDAVQVARATSEVPSFFRTWCTDVGLIAPLCLAVGLVGEAIAELLHCPDAPSWFRLMRWLQPVDTRRRARLAAMLVAAPVVCLTGCLALARVAVLCLSLPGPANAVGALLAAAGAGVALLGVGIVVAIGRTLGVRLRRNPPNPLRFALVGLGSAIGAFLLFVALGSTSGSGGVFAIFGVFRRQELDLRAPTLLLLLLLSGYASSWMIGLAGKWQRLVMVCAAVPLALTFYAARWGMEVRAVALSIERSSPLGQLMLSPLRRVNDRDKDGFSSAFGGGDCNDRNPLVNPGVDDVPGNGVDEDCSGSDANTLVAASATQAPKSSAWRSLVPKHLNVVFLSIDTVRADVFNDSRPILPHLRELEQRGITYPNAYAPASYTLSASTPARPIVTFPTSMHSSTSFFCNNAYKMRAFERSVSRAIGTSIRRPMGLRRALISLTLPHRLARAMWKGIALPMRTSRQTV
jgi:hypothetical protein